MALGRPAAPHGRVATLTDDLLRLRDELPCLMDGLLWPLDDLLRLANKLPCLRTTCYGFGTSCYGNPQEILTIALAR
jgi:hypothetical protein